MNKEELYALPPGDPPVLLKDGLIGLLLVYPTERSVGERSEECGIQVPNEELHRWIPMTKLVNPGNGALIEFDGALTAEQKRVLIEMGVVKPSPRDAFAAEFQRVKG